MVVSARLSNLPGTGAPGASSRTRRIATRACAAAFVLATSFLASGCASTDADVADEGADDVVKAPVAADVSVPQLARELGLRFSVVPGTDRLALESDAGGRILLFPGTRVASVGGRQIELGDSPFRRGNEYWLFGTDANAVRRTWSAQSAANANLPPQIADGYRVPIPERPTPGPYTPSVQTQPVAAPAGSTDNRPTAAETAAWTVPLRRKWQYLVVHHSASAAGNAAAIDRWHKDRGFDGLGYDFVIGNGTGSTDGAVEVGYRWKQQLVGAHAKTAANFMNEHGIGVCLVGDFTRTRPTAAQMRSLDRLCTFLAQYCGIPAENLRMHGEVKSTECPGKYFPHEFAIRVPPRGSRAAAVNAADGSSGSK